MLGLLFAVVVVVVVAAAAVVVVLVGLSPRRPRMVVLSSELLLYWRRVLVSLLTPKSQILTTPCGAQQKRRCSETVENVIQAANGVTREVTLRHTSLMIVRACFH